MSKSNSAWPGLDQPTRSTVAIPRFPYDVPHKAVGHIFASLRSKRKNMPLLGGVMRIFGWLCLEAGPCSMGHTQKPQ